MTSTPIEDDLDVIFDVLRNRRRRFVIQQLEDGGAKDPGELADILADRKPTDRKTAYISLYQNHLPKLDDSGVVDWDGDSGIVVQGPEFDRHLAASRAAKYAVRGDVKGLMSLIKNAV